MPLSNSKRHFSRIPFQAEAHILSADNAEKWPCTLFDLSLNGALTSQPVYWSAKPGDHFRLELQLGSTHEKSLRLLMDVSVAHIEAEHVGFHIVEMDIDTISHLHRLIELNTGSASILDRELAELIAQHISSTGNS